MSQEQNQRINIEEYLIEKTSVNKELLSRIDNQIKEIRETNFAFEKKTLIELNYQSAIQTYERLKQDILTIQSYKKVSEKEILTVPGVCVYNFSEPRTHIVMNTSTQKYPYFEKNSPTNLPAEIGQQILSSFAMPIEIENHYMENHYKEYAFAKSSKQTKIIERKWKKHTPFTMEREFKSVIPTDARAKIKTAQEVFDEEIYLIERVTDWESTEQPKELIVMGWLRKELFYITKFEPIPIQNIESQKHKK
ncbi:MAG: hypothetical protein ABIC91_04465 [Nanoarchaeota archaeon]|nr:hypothetical protein [Nanoarchaeota archaeon]MBU1849764.1 hypothetical protein [Nanoarchaeota archaeon]